MKIHFLAIAFLFFSFKLSAQNSPKAENPPEVLTVVEQMPEYPGGTDSLMAYLFRTIHYPIKAKEAGIQGRVVMKFIVDETGNVTNIEILKDIGFGCGEEVKRVLSSLPKRFIPGRQSGAAVKVYYSLPVKFTLN